VEIHFSTILTSMLHGLILGMVLVIVAGGLTIIFGMLDVLNFAHGSLYMLEATDSLSEAFGKALRKHGLNARVAFVPFGRYTVLDV